MKRKIFAVWLLLAIFAVMPAACSGGNAAAGVTTTVTTPPASTPVTVMTTTTTKTPETTVTTTPSTPVTSTTITKTSALPTPPSQEELAKAGFTLPEIPRISCEQLKPMIDSGGNFVLIDTRVKTSFILGYLPGAIDIPVDSSTPEWVNQQLALIPGDKMAIFYCDCPDDKESATMANNLIQMRSGDMTNVKVLWKGYYRWLELGYPITK